MKKVKLSALITKNTPDMSDRLVLSSATLTDITSLMRKMKINSPNLATPIPTTTQDGAFLKVPIPHGLKAGIEYILSFDAEVITNKKRISAYAYSGTTAASPIFGVPVTGDGRYYIHITASSNADSVYIYPQTGFSPPGGANAGKITFSNITVV